MRRQFLPSILMLFLPAITSGQAPPSSAAVPTESELAVRAFPPELRKQMVQLREAAFEDDYAYKQLAHLTDSIGPRPAGSPQADAAAKYVADELRKLGLEVRLEPVAVRRFLRENDSAELVEYPGQAQGTTQKIVLSALMGNTPTASSGITAEVVVVNNFDELKQLGREKVSGKIVLFNEIYDHRKAVAGQSGAAYGEAVLYRSAGAAAAASLGAVGALVRSAGDGAYRLAHTGWSGESPIPAGAVTPEDAGLIARLVAQGRVKIHLTLTSHQAPESTGYNVIGDLKGSAHPEQVVVVSGHLDSWDLGTGAIDDGAGVVVAMEAAELVRKLGLHPKRTLRVVAWMNEEMGATGRDSYSKEFATEIPNHVGAIESDGGAEHPLGFQAKISETAQKELSPVLDVLKPFGGNLIQLVTGSPGTDIELLADKGVPAFGVWQSGLTYFTYHHTAADTLDKVDPAQLRENATCMAVLGYALADMTEPLAK